MLGANPLGAATTVITTLRSSAAPHTAPAPRGDDAPDALHGGEWPRVDEGRVDTRGRARHGKSEYIPMGARLEGVRHYHRCDSHEAKQCDGHGIKCGWRLTDRA